jgi:hypothetical protein
MRGTSSILRHDGLRHGGREDSPFKSPFLVVAPGVILVGAWDRHLYCLEERSAAAGASA